MNKEALRRHMADLRAALSDREREDAEDKLIERLFRLPLTSPVMIYNSFNSEFPTKRITDKLLKSGFEVYMPKTRRCEISAVKFNKKTEKGAFGIEEPIGETADKRIIKTCIIPGLAFDRFGNRCGYGKGCYDRFLKGTSCFKIGICFDFQTVDKIDVSGDDIPCDTVVTEKNTYGWNDEKI